MYLKLHNKDVHFSFLVWKVAQLIFWHGINVFEKKGIYNASNAMCKAKFAYLPLWPKHLYICGVGSFRTRGVFIVKLLLSSTVYSNQWIDLWTF